MTTNGTPGTELDHHVASVTASLGETVTSSVGGDTEYRRGGQLFAVIDGSRISIHLRPDIAEAALRTPATAPSPRGHDWIEFEPTLTDPQDADRLAAWLTIGWRAAQRHN